MTDDNKGLDFVAIEKKWQKNWEDAKIFEANPDDSPKFFVNFPYPYINAYQHIGHLFTLMRIEAFARYKRLKGFNVLFPQGWHATGSPIVNAAKRVKEREEKQIKIMKDMGFSEEDLVKFEDPKYWIDFFIPEYKKDYKSLGMSIDWRREFHTTSINPYYDKFIQWQFNKLKEKGYVVKGKFPVVWDPKDGAPVGDHDRVEGEGETPQEFCLFKFKLDDGRKIITATLRPDTVMGITNVYVNPEETYSEIEIKGEKWIVGKPIIEKLKMQDFEIKETNDVFGKDLVGKDVESFSGLKIPVLPASFLDSNYGTGMVHSVPSDSADDLIALQDLQKNDELIKKYGLDSEKIKSIKPIEIFETPGMGSVPAQDFLNKYGVKTQNERGKLEKIKKELYKLTFNQATFNDKYAKEFSKDLKGVLVKNGQDLIKKELVQKGSIELFYELTGKVVSRSLTECVVKIVDDQWFMNYADPKWKALAHKCLNQMKLYPEKARPQFDYVIDWLHEWACTREEGLGTRLPWDNKWLIESLSDSTIYMAYYTIAHLIEKVSIENINDSFFDYVFYEKGNKPNVEHIDEMKQNFDYFYPVDYRNSGKDLIQNHLTFFIFNHVAMFEEKHWPTGIGANGWVTVDGQKMSKSLGNMIPVRDVVKKYTADASRITILNGGEEMDDPNWDSNFARTIIKKLSDFYDFCIANYGKHNRTDMTGIDNWFESELNRIIKDATTAMELTLFRTSIQSIYFDMQRIIKHYMKRTDNNPNKDLLNKFIETQLIMLSPFTAHFCEETWEAIGKKEFISQQTWPVSDESKINLELSMAEESLSTLLTDIRKVMELAKLEKLTKIKLIISPKWKYDFFALIKSKLEETREVKSLIGACMADENLRKNGNDITKMIPSIIKDPSKLPSILLNQDKEEDNTKTLVKQISDEFKAEIIIERSESSQETKAKQASPGKPAIVVE